MAIRKKRNKKIEEENIGVIQEVTPILEIKKEKKEEKVKIENPKRIGIQDSLERR